MATPPELVRAVSTVTGLPLATVTDMDRRLVTEGLRSKSGRGPSAAQITPLDAARLLTAVLASPQSNKAADAVRRYEQTKPDSKRSNERGFGSTGLEDLAALPANHSFVEGLCSLLRAATSGQLAKLATGASPHIEVFAFTGTTHGRIRLSGLPGGRTASVEYVNAEKQTPKRRVRKPSHETDIGDLEQSRRVTEQTILAVASLLARE